MNTTAATPDPAADWAPDACTLPTAEQPLRVAEFDHLFATGLRALERLSPTTLRLYLDADVHASAVDLTDRETGCCSFFTFSFTPVGDLIGLDATVPPAHTAVLDALATRAGTTARAG